MNNPDITLRCMNGFTVHIKAENLIVESKRKEETFPISKIQSFALKNREGSVQAQLLSEQLRRQPAG